MKHRPVMNHTGFILRMFWEAKLDMLRKMLAVHEEMRVIFQRWSELSQEGVTPEFNLIDWQELAGEFDSCMLVLEQMRSDIESIDQRTWLIQDELSENDSADLKEMDDLQAIADDIKKALVLLIAENLNLEQMLNTIKGVKFPLALNKEEYYFHAVLDFRRKLEKFQVAQTS